MNRRDGLRRMVELARRNLTIAVYGTPDPRVCVRIAHTPAEVLTWPAVEEDAKDGATVVRIDLCGQDLPPLRLVPEAPPPAALARRSKETTTCRRGK